MEFKCSICNYTSQFKTTIERHITKQKKCGENPSIIEVPIEIKCEFCNKLYKTRENLVQHLKICKVKKSNVELELELVKKELADLKRNQASVNITNITNNITNNNNYTIQLKPYNSPVLPDDMDDIYEEAWLKQKSIAAYVERVHFNTDLPENHNMCITNLRTKLAAKVFNGTDWETKDQDKMLDELISNTNIMLERWIRLNRKKRQQFETDFLNYLESAGKKKFDEETKTELKLLLYDNYKNGTVNIKSNTQTPYVYVEDENS